MSKFVEGARSLFVAALVAAAGCGGDWSSPEEMAGGSLYWIYEHALIGRSPILGFEQREDGRWWIRLEPRLIPVTIKPRRAHQGWRYLKEEDAPRDLGEGESAGDVMPPKLARELAKLGLV